MTLNKYSNLQILSVVKYSTTFKCSGCLLSTVFKFEKTKKKTQSRTTPNTIKHLYTITQLCNEL